jgi:hypothetical protein
MPDPGVSYLQTVQRLDSRFKFTSKTPILDNLNDLLTAIEARIQQVEAVGTTLDEILTDLEDQVTARMDSTFTPLILAAQEALSSYGISFRGHSDSNAAIGTGPLTITLDLETRDSFYYADYCAVRPTAEPDYSMIGTVTSYTRETGVLVLDIDIVVGSGSYSEWDVNISSPPDLVHASRTDNPHATTAAQVGSYTEAETDTAIAAAIAALPPQADALLRANNLSDLPNAATARFYLGLGDLAVQDSVNGAQLAADVWATQDEAEGGTDNTGFLTSLRLQQALDETSSIVIDGGTF